MASVTEPKEDTTTTAVDGPGGEDSDAPPRPPPQLPPGTTADSLLEAIELFFMEEPDSDNDNPPGVLDKDSRRQDDSPADSKDAPSGGTANAAGAAPVPHQRGAFKAALAAFLRSDDRVALLAEHIRRLGPLAEYDEQRVEFHSAYKAYGRILEEHLAPWLAARGWSLELVAHVVDQVPYAQQQTLISGDLLHAALSYDAFVRMVRGYRSVYLSENPLAETHDFAL
eukprot:TRINITY_DN15620_c0_g1_i1.p1 TRINITY_DN15620_c0_g1~~TRINITY_DN15620_c0_g1_i1.p1  ORF type:complete len:226 (-),score=42.76 TRINITY_DN15620_c0_g1_i1:56-733(-)